MNRPLKEHFEVETDVATTLRTFDYIEALEKYCDHLEQVNSVDLADVGGNEVALCRCSEDETTGWIKLKCCNICGKPQEQ